MELSQSGKVASGKTQVGADFELHHLGKPCAPNGWLQTMSEHQHPDPAQLILHKEQMLVVSGQNQSLQLTGLGKSLSLTCQHQSRLNYKCKLYSAHTKDTLNAQLG